MTLSAVLHYDVGQASSQDYARKAGTKAPVVLNTIGSIVVEGLEIHVTLSRN